MTQNSELLRQLSEQKTDDSESWLLSYVDVFILLSTLFVLLFSLTQKNVGRDKELQNKIDDLSAKLEQLEESTKPEVEEETVKQEWQALMKEALSSIRLTDTVTLNVEDDFAQLEIQDEMLFDSGDAILKSDGRVLFDKIIPLLKLSDGLIFIEGHTDNVPIRTENYPSNWELGAARASNVLRYLVSQDFDPTRLRAVSYADTNPIVPNSSVENRRRNRRVSLLIQVPGAHLK